MNHHTHSTPDIAYKAENTPHIADKAENHLDLDGSTETTLDIAIKTKPVTKCSDRDCNLWVWTRDLPLLSDTLRSAGKNNFDDYRLCQIALRLARGQGYRFKANGKIYEIDPDFFNKLRDYYYRLKAENPSKLADRVRVSDLNTLIERGDA